MYLIIALAIIVFSVMAVTERRILRAATYLLFTLFAAAGFYFMLDYQFLGAVQIAVYAGGIMVLFVFAILLTHKPGEKTALLSSKKKALGAIAALLSLSSRLPLLDSVKIPVWICQPSVRLSWALPARSISSHSRLSVCCYWLV